LISERETTNVVLSKR